MLEGNPVKGMTTLVAICDYDTGYHAGVEAGKYAKEKLGGKAKVMNVGLPLLSATVLRSEGFMDGIKTEIPDATMVHDLDGGGNPDRSFEVSAAALAQNGDINVIYGINDSSSLGGLQAWKAAGKSQDDLLVVGTGGEGLAFINAMENEPSYQDRSGDVPGEGRLHGGRRRGQALQQGRSPDLDRLARPRRWSAMTGRSTIRSKARPARSTGTLSTPSSAAGQVHEDCGRPQEVSRTFDLPGTAIRPRPFVAMLSRRSRTPGCLTSMSRPRHDQRYPARPKVRALIGALTDNSQIVLVGLLIAALHRHFAGGAAVLFARTMSSPSCGNARWC